LVRLVEDVIEPRHLVHQGMPDVAHRYSVAAVEVHFEPEQDQHLAHPARDRLHPPLAPRPDLRAHVVDDGNAQLLQPPSEPQVEPRRVDQERGRRSPPLGLRQQIAEDAAGLGDHA
jgi:hypothetical protein